MCLYPKIIKNPKYKANKKNRGVIPPVKDERTKYVPIGCQNCMECRKKKAREWQARLQEEIKANKNGKFVTLTFSTESLRKIHQAIKDQGIQLEGYELDNQIAVYAMRHFLERWRKQYKKSLRHWFVTELGHGQTEHLHFHGIIWTDESLTEVENKWSYGHVWKGKRILDKLVNYVNEKTVNYTVKYVSKTDLQHKYYKPIVLTSPGIGSSYTKTTNAKNNRFNQEKTREYFKTRTGHKIALPIYWRNKIYTEEQREQLWLYKLDKQERWICGERISIKKGEEEYYKTLKWYRRLNRQLGYGNDEKDWSREQYERERRMLIHKQRLLNET